MAKKKQWFDIVSPKIFGSIKVGETIAYEGKNIIGRIVKANMRDLTGDFKKSHINVKLIIDKVVENKAQTSIYGYSIQRQYLQRFLYKKISKVELITDTETKDKKKVRLKLLVTINGRVQTTKKKIIRSAINKELVKLTNSIDLDNLVFMCAMNKVQATIANKIKKVHPVKFVEMKKIDLLK